MKYEISTQDYKTLRDQNAPHALLDVRQNWEVGKASIPGSTHIPLTDLLDRLDELDKKGKIVAYCHHGIRSLNACFFLRELGFEDVVSLSGGIEAWAHEIDPSVPTY